MNQKTQNDQKKPGKAIVPNRDLGIDWHKRNQGCAKRQEEIVAYNKAFKSDSQRLAFSVQGWVSCLRCHSLGWVVALLTP